MLGSPLPAAALGPPPVLEQLVGERLEFDVRWGIVPAGRASLEVVSAGPERLLFRAEARTHPAIDWIYPVRDRIESTVLLPGARSLRFYQKAKEGWGDPRETEVLFDAAAGIARRSRDGKPERELRVPAAVLDPLSCFYAYRGLPLPKDEEARLEVTDGKRVITGTVTVLRREQLTTPAGTFATVVVEPRLEGIGGIFRKSPGARIFVWLTDDQWRRPVKLESEVIVGAFTAELARVTPPAPSPPAPR